MIVPYLITEVRAFDATAFGTVVNPIISNIIVPIIELIVSIGLIVFVWGIIEMIIYADDADAKTKGRNHMLSGLLGIFIMLSAWGIIYLISNTVKQFGN
jgi:hypothetical protein